MTPELQEALERYTVPILDGLDDALVGFDENNLRAVYSEDRIFNILVNRDNMTYEDAIDFFDFNIQDAVPGDQAPLFIKTWE